VYPNTQYHIPKGHFRTIPHLYVCGLGGKLLVFHRTSPPFRELVKRCLGKIIRQLDSIVHTETGLWSRQAGIKIPAGERDFLLKMSRLELGPTQSAVQWVPSRVQSNQNMILTTDIHLVQRFRVSGAIPVLYFIQSNHNLAKDISSLPTSLWVLDWESIQTVPCNKYELQ